MNNQFFITCFLRVVVTKQKIHYILEKNGQSKEEGEAHHCFVVEMVGGKARGIHYFGTLDKQSNGTSYADDKGNIYETISTSSTATHSAGSEDDQRLDDVHEHVIEVFDLIFSGGRYTIGASH